MKKPNREVPSMDGLIPDHWHEAILEEVERDPERAEGVRKHGRNAARRAGLTEEQIAKYYPGEKK